MTGTKRQHTVDTSIPTAVRCHYADDPARRPRCTLTATVAFGTLALCTSCAARRSTIGKGQPAVALPTSPTLDVLAWIRAAHHNANAAERSLTSAITRAHQAGQPWSAIAAQLGVTRQAAQQRFARASMPSTIKTTGSN